MIFIYNQNEEQIKILDIEYKFTREINQVNTLEFECEYDLEKGYRAIIFEDNKPYEFIIIDSDYTREDISTFVYFCQDSIIENAGNPILDKRPSGSHKVALNSIFENTRWTVEYAGSFSESYAQSNSFFRISVLEALSQIIEEYNLEWYTKFLFTDSNITTRTVVIGKIGSKANSRLEFGKNIQSFKRRILPDTIITALYGYGKGEELESGAYGRRINFSSINNGLEYVTNEAAKLKYGIGPKNSKKHVFDFFIDENETDINNLLKNTKKELERRSQVQAEYTVNAIDLNLDASFGYTVDVLDDEIDFSGSVRIIKEVREAGNIEFTFGHITKSFLNQISKEIQKSSEKTKLEVTSLMETRLNEITDIYFGEDGYNYDLAVNNEYNLPAGLYSFDKPIDQNPGKVIYIGAGKMLIADGKKPDGTWDWKTAATGEGIAGETIIANSITANKLAADVGQSLDLSSNQSITQTVSNQVVGKLSEPEMIKLFKGADGRPGRDGENGANGQDFKWNLLVDSNKVFHRNNYDLARYNLSVKALDLQIGDEVSLVIKGHFNNSGRTHFALYNSSGYAPMAHSYARDFENGIRVITFNWQIAEQATNPNTYITMYQFPNNDTTGATIEWITLVKGKPASTTEWFPSIEDLQGRDGQDATIYSATPPSDTTKLWHSSTDNEIRYYNRELSEWIGLDKKALDTIEGLRLDVSSEIKNTGDSILQTVQESYYSIGQTDELIRQQESTIESTSDKISLAISSLQKIVDENKNLTDDEFQFIKTYFDFKDDGLLIGKSNSTLTVELKNDRLSFNDNGREVAYMSNNKLYVYDGEFMNSLKIGKFQWVPRESGNLSFVRVR